MAYVRFHCIYVKANWTGLNLYYHKSKKPEYNKTLLSHIVYLTRCQQSVGAHNVVLLFLLILIHVYDQLKIYLQETLI